MISHQRSYFVVAGVAAAALHAAPCRAGSEAQLLWQFEIGDITLDQFITVAADGTIYTSDNEGVYAIDPAGELIWFVPSLGGGRPIALGNDGTLHVARTLVSPNPGLITALNPDGSIAWEFTSPFSSPVKVGPNIGPDDNIYAVQNTTTAGENGLGMFSLNAEGELRWSNVGDPPLHTQNSAENSAIVFNPDQLFLGMVAFTPSGGPILRSFDLDGEQLWYELDLDFNMKTYPRLDPQGRVVGSRGQTGVQAISPANANIQWISYHPQNANDVLRPTVADDGTIYTGDWLGIELWALNPDGSTLWVQPYSGDTLAVLTLSPDNETLIAGGGGSFGEAAFVRGYSAAEGALLWQIDIPSENGAISIINSFDAAFSPDGSTAYVTVQFAGDVNDYGYLAAIRFAEPDNTLIGDLNSDGGVDIFDLLMLLEAWGTSSADMNDDGTTDVGDLLMLLSHWA